MACRKDCRWIYEEDCDGSSSCRFYSCPTTCDCIIGHFREVCLLPVLIGVVITVLFVFSIACCVQKCNNKKKKKKKKEEEEETTSVALVSASPELEDDVTVEHTEDAVTVEHTIEVNDSPAEKGKLFQPSARALARGLISVFFLTIVLSDSAKMLEVTTTYEYRLGEMSFAEMSTTFSATFSTLKVELDGSFPGFPSFPIAERSMTWKEYCATIEDFDDVIQTFRYAGLLIPGDEQCFFVTLARPFIISALVLYFAASVYALHPRGDLLGMVASMLGWLGVVGGVSLWLTVLRDWTGIKTGLGMLLSIAFFGVTLITRVLPKRQ